MKKNVCGINLLKGEKMEQSTVNAQIESTEDTKTSDKSLEKYIKLITNKFSYKEKIGKSIGFTKPTLEQRKEKNRKKEKARRKENLKRQKG